MDPNTMDQQRFDIEFSDEWWFKRLFDAFYKRSKKRDGITRTRPEWADYLWRFYIGNPDLPQHAQGWQAKVTRDVLQMGRANLAYLAIESKLDRLQFLAFSTTITTDDKKVDGPDAAARRLMQKYGTVFDDATLFASVMNEGYIWVGEPGRDGLAAVTAEDPRSCVTIDDPLDPYTSIAALKLYHDDLADYDYAHVVLPPLDEVKDPETNEVISAAVGSRLRVARRPAKTTTVSSSFRATNWSWVDEKSGEFPAPGQGRGTLVHHIMAPNMIGDLEPAIDILERINNNIVDRLWIQKFQVFRQRAMQDANEDPDAGEAFPEEDEDGNKIDWDQVLAADPGAVWQLPAGVKIWESTPTDLQGILLSIRDDIKEFAAVTRTPMYIFSPDAAQGSAEGATLLSDSAVAKAEKWQKRMLRSFAAVCGDMLAVSGHGVPDTTELSLTWGPTKRESLNQKATAAVAAQQAGVPWEGRMRDFLHLSPEQIIEYRQFRNNDLLYAAENPAPTTRPADIVTPPEQVAPPKPLDAVDQFINRPPPVSVPQSA